MYYVPSNAEGSKGLLLFQGMPGESAGTLNLWVFPVFVMRGGCRVRTFGRVISFRNLVYVIGYFEQSNFVASQTYDTSLGCALGKFTSNNCVGTA